MQRNRALLSATGLVLAILLVAVLRFWPMSRMDTSVGDDVVDDPRLTYSTPFRNVRPDVQYVGDASCADCHRDQERSFHHHPMGRATTPIAAAASRQRYDTEVRNPFDALGVRFRISRQGDQVTHEEIHSDAHGDPLTETRAEVSYVIGSGAHAQSYLIIRGEHVFQSPITWFVEKKRWNISPGFERILDHFERQVTPECLFCHCNYANPIKDTLNRYHLPLFPRGESIGCERCHGPGELHVKERRDGLPISSDVDYSIVNPRHLEPSLREAVCEQCHLEAEQRVLRRGREVFDFRPGLPLYLFWSDFLRLPELEEHGKFVGKVEQMHSSQCFTQSKGEMSCNSCHDAHALPTPDKKTAYYRQQCVECHRKKECSLPLPQRQAKQDNCVACHMPRINSTDISHTAIIDHRVLRQPQLTAAAPVPRKLRPGEIPLIHFHKDQLAPDDPEVVRDLGIAVVNLARAPTPLSEQLGETALPYIESALRRGPRDMAALRARAFLLSQRGRYREALQLIEQILARSPNHESALDDALVFAQNAGEQEKALDYARKLVAVSPYITRYRVQRIVLLTLLKRYDDAIAECGEALRFNPASVKVRSMLVTCHLKKGQKELAREEFATIVKLNPPDKDDLVRWFEEQLKR